MTNKHIIAPPTKKVVLFLTFPFKSPVSGKVIGSAVASILANKQKCHAVSYLNCYLCACPHFRFNDDGLTIEKNSVIKSQCSIASKKSAWFVHENVVHLDCSRCSLPHTKAFIRKHFDRDWREIMKECFTSPKACEKQ